MYPPSVGSPPGNRLNTQSAAQWIWKVLPSLPLSQRPLQCMQEAGEVMYVPESWLHAVINVGDTVSVAGQSWKPSFGTLEYQFHQVIICMGSSCTQSLTQFIVVCEDEFS
jgi:hypothetical protein